jgi:copper transport protein
VALALAALVGMWPGTASAHAELLTSDPAPGSVLDVAPAAVTLHFSEDVEISLGAVRLFDGNGTAVVVNEATHPDGDRTRVEVVLPPLPDGSYVVDWRVISGDSHPVHAAFTFQIGASNTLAPGVLDQIIGAAQTNRTAGIGLVISRFLVIAAVAMVFGGLGAVAAGIVPPTSRLRLMIVVGGAIGMFAGLLALPLEAGYATGRSLSVITDGSAWRAMFDTQSGTAWVVRAVLLGVGASLAWRPESSGAAWWRSIFIGALIGVGVASAYGGHGASGRWQAVGILATTLHVTAMALWLGGLVAVLMAIRSIDHAQLRRFSTCAFALICVVAASGVVQSFRQLGSGLSSGQGSGQGVWHQLTNSAYGRLLLWKVVAVVAVIGVASVSRTIVRQRTELDRPRLLRTITIEVVVATVIVGLTSLLMAANPTAASASPVSVTIVNGDYLASIAVSPGQRGPNELHIYLSSASSSLDQPDDITVEIVDPSRDVPITIPVERAGAGHFTTGEANFPYPATWTLTVTARYHSFDVYTFSTQVTIS